MSKYFQLVKQNYDRGFWTLQQVRNAVSMGWITENEFEEITGVEY